MLMLDVIFKFFAEILDHGAYWHRRCIAEGANCLALDIVSDGIQHIQIIRTAMAMLYPMHHAIQPTRTFTAWCALTAGFFKIEIRQAQQ